MIVIGLLIYVVWLLKDCTGILAEGNDTQIFFTFNSWESSTLLVHEGQKCSCIYTQESWSNRPRKRFKQGQKDDKLIYQLANLTDMDNTHYINLSMILCPRQFCENYYRQDDESDAVNGLTPIQTYGYGTLAVLLISLCSVAGVLLMPIVHCSIYKYVITGFIAFGLGFMMGDALLHLIPEALGSHCEGHDDEAGGAPLWRSVLIMLTIFGLFTFETVMDLAHHQEKTSHRCPRRHSHSHIPFPEDLLPWREAVTPDRLSQPSSPQPQPHPVEPNASSNKEAVASGSSKPPSSPATAAAVMEANEASTFRDLKPLALVILLGDAVHNFGDGLAVGAAFTSGAQSGISTSLAIFCHELPHEFGDFVILRSTGLSLQQALMANLASALTAFLGLYVGVNLGFEHSMRQWIFAFTAAMFLYIAVGDMLPELRNHNKTISVLTVQSISMLIGMGMVLLLHAIEHELLGNDDHH